MPEMLKFELPKNQSSIIKVIGVGGGGSNAVTHMYNQGIRGVDFMICNTDRQALETSPVPLKIQLGTKGLGAGAIPQVGKEAANENIDDIRKVLETNTKMVFITAGMGGGTGTGAAPVIASLAKELDILTVGIVTIPFSFEGRKRTQQALSGIEELRKSVDTLLIICNDKLRELEGDLKLSEAFSKADNILTVAARGIAEIITVTGYINVDFEDVKTVMKDSGKAIMGSGLASGENRALEAVQMAMASPLLDEANIRGASNILLYMASGTEEITLDEVMDITDYIQHEAGVGADLIWGNGTDDTLEDKISVTLIATGFDSKTKETNESPRKQDRIIYNLHKEPEKTDTSPIRSEAIPAPAPIEEVTLISKNREQESNPVPPPLPRPTITEPKASQEESRTIIFEFNEPKPDDITPRKPIESFSATPVKTGKEKEPGFDFLRKFAPAEDNDNDDAENIAKQEERANDRYARLMEMSMKITTPEGLTEIENQPAYLRKNVELKETPSSESSEVSRYTLFKTDNNPTEMRQSNSFLHDNVD